MLLVAAHAAVILLTLGLGWQVTNRWSALFAAALVAFLPMMAAMARLFYTEMLLTAAVAFNLLALYKSRVFSRRGCDGGVGSQSGDRIAGQMDDSACRSCARAVGCVERTSPTSAASLGLQSAALRHWRSFRRCFS